MRSWRSPSSTLFPYTTLFRSGKGHLFSLLLHHTRKAILFLNLLNGQHLPSSHGPEKLDRKSTRLNSSHLGISYAVFCLKKKKVIIQKYKNVFKFCRYEQILMS